MFGGGRNQDKKMGAGKALIDPSTAIQLSRTNERSLGVLMAHTTTASYCEVVYWPQAAGQTPPPSAQKVSCGESPVFTHQVVLPNLDPDVVYWFQLSFGMAPNSFSESRQLREGGNDYTNFPTTTDKSNMILSRINGSLGTLSLTSLRGFGGGLPKINLGCFPKAVELFSLLGSSTPSKLDWISIGGKKSENSEPSPFVSMRIPSTMGLQKPTKLELSLDGGTQGVDLPKAPVLSRASLVSNTELSFGRVRLGSATTVVFPLGQTLEARWQTQNIDGDAYVYFDARVQGENQGFSCIYDAKAGVGKVPVEELTKFAGRPVLMQLKLLSYKTLKSSADIPIVIGSEDFRRRVVTLK
jgi:hypothetical protein